MHQPQPQDGSRWLIEYGTTHVSTLHWSEDWLIEWLITLEKLAPTNVSTAYCPEPYGAVNTSRYDQTFVFGKVNECDAFEMSTEGI